MSWEILAFILVIVVAILIEYRLRKPDQIVLFEKKGVIKKRTSKFFPRHFSMPIPGTVHSQMIEVEAEAKGHILVNIRIALAVAASIENLDKLVRAGGWNQNCITNALNESNVLLESYIKEFSENYEIDDISPEKLTEYLKKKIIKDTAELGLNIVSLSTQSIEPKDKEITIALQQKEEARLQEQTEMARQKARTAIAKTKVKADEQIFLSEHELELKKLELQKVREKSEAEIADKRVQDEISRKNMQLSFEQKEMELLKANPELLMLSPQLARLAEASQQLPNAKTVVSLAQNDIQKGSQIIETIQTVLQTVFSNKQNTEKK